MVLLALLGCNPDDGAPPCVPEGDFQPGSVFVLNEGNFTFGNASVTYFNPTNGEVWQTIFEASNGVGPGDVAQSLTIVDQTGYLVVNNSQKIEKIDLNTFTVELTGTGFNSPRYLLPFGATFGYVSDLYEDQIYKVRLSSLDIAATIPVNGWVEKMIVVEDKIWACHKDGNREVLILNPDNDQIESAIPLGVDPNDILLDDKNTIWVCGTKEAPDYNTMLYRIDQSSQQVTDSIEISNDQPIAWLAIDSTNNWVYLLSKTVSRFEISSSQLIEEPFVAPAIGTRFYSIEVAPNTGEVYLGDAKDYLQEGEVLRCATDGTLLGSFSTGIIPGRIVFYP